MRKALLASTLLAALGLASGCHYGSDDDHPGSGYYSRNDSYREGFRDGRTYERQRSGWGYSRYDDRYRR